MCRTEIALCLQERDLNVGPTVCLCSASFSSHACVYQLYRGSLSANSKALFFLSVRFALKLYVL